MENNIPNAFEALTELSTHIKLERFYSITLWRSDALKFQGDFNSTTVFELQNVLPDLELNFNNECGWVQGSSIFELPNGEKIKLDFTLT